MNSNSVFSLNQENMGTDSIQTENDNINLNNFYLQEKNFNFSFFDCLNLNQDALNIINESGNYTLANFYLDNFNNGLGNYLNLQGNISNYTSRDK
jgi:hypothetical protein